MILRRILFAIGFLVFCQAGLQAAARKNPAPEPQGTDSLRIQDGAIQWTLEGRPLVSQRIPQLRLADGSSLTWTSGAGKVKGNTATISGAFSGKDAEVRAEWTYTLSPDGTTLDTAVKTAWKVAQPIATLQFDFGLNLAPRKRVFFAGQYGLDWETRYFYQFHLSALGALLSQPDRNEWRWFGLERNAGHGFRLWKAESDTTPPIIMQEALEMSFSALLYDEKEAVLFDVIPHDPAAPLRLLVDASGSASVSVEVISPPHSPPGRFIPAAQRIEGEAEFRCLTRVAKGASGLARLRTDLKSRATDDKTTLPGTGREWADKDSAVARPRRVSVGVPFVRGTLSPDQSVAVQMGGTSITPQVTPLAYWPDRSVKWGLLSFRLPDSMTGEPAPGAPYLSFRDGSKTPIQVAPASRGVSGEPLATFEETPRPLVTIQTGPLQVVLTDGKAWWRKLVVKGRPLITDTAGGVRAYADYVRDFQSWNSLDGRIVGGQSDEADLVVERIALEDNGPERAVVRLEGSILNKEPTRCLLWLEFRAGSASIRVWHTAEFLFKDPRKTALTSLGLEFSLEGFSPTALISQNAKQPVVPGKGSALTLEQITPNAFQLFSEMEGSSEALAAGTKAEGWMLATGADFSILAAVRNFAPMAPKAIAMSADAPFKVSFALWPESAGPMDVRRYSNYPHRGQSETASAEYDYVDKGYYHQDPFVGESRSHDLLLDFLPPTETAEAAREIAADFESPPLLFPGSARITASKVLPPGYPEDSGKFARKGMDDYLKFWRFHQNLHQWLGFWSYGDIRHYFHGGYGWLAKPEALSAALKRLEAGENPKDIIIAPPDRILDYFPPNDWAYDNGRWGWGNTEGMPGLLFQTEYLRTGERELFFAAEATARHARDVVTRHAGKWLGAGTRHGVQHWSDGDHEERQTTAGEFKYHYFLTGDPRTRQVIEDLYQKHYSRTPVAIHASHSGRLQGLLFHWEVTGDPAEGEQFKKYVESMLSPEGIYESADVSFPGPTVNKPPRGLNGGSMFFQVFGAMHALLEYELLTGHPGLHRSLLAVADGVLKDPRAREKYHRGRVSPMMFGALGYAARFAEDTTPYRQWLTEAFQAAQWKLALAMIPDDPSRWSGDQAFVGLSIPGSLFLMNFVPWLWGSLDAGVLADPAWAEKIADHQKSAKIPRRLPLSWQSEYDSHKDLQNYLSQDRPWEPAPPPPAPVP